MAGDWIKFDCTLPDKPETLAITVAMGWDDPDLTVGKLMRLFTWFDQHTTDGNADGVTTALLDRVAGASGFVRAVADARWIVIGDGRISLCKFERHNGATAKSRAQTAKRVANHKANQQSNAGSVSEALPREEKSREELKPIQEDKARKRATPSSPVDKPDDVDPQVWADWLTLRKAKRAPVTDTVVDGAISEAAKAGMSLEAYLRVWCARGSQGLQAEWLKPHERAGPQQSGETPWQRSQRLRVHEMTGGLAAAKAPGSTPTNLPEIFDVTARRLG